MQGFELVELKPAVEAIMTLFLYPLWSGRYAGSHDYVQFTFSVEKEFLKGRLSERE